MRVKQTRETKNYCLFNMNCKTENICRDAELLPSDTNKMKRNIKV